jgi:hypothetical protein
MTMKNDIALAAFVDRLAHVKARIADLKAEEEQLKQLLIDSGEAVIESSTYRAAVSLLPGRAITDWKTVAEKFSPSVQLVTAHTKHGDEFYSVRVSSRSAA